MTSPAALLADALMLLSDDDLLVLADRAGVPRHAAVRAKNGAHGHPTDAGHHLRLCAAIGLDPLPEIVHPMIVPGEFGRKLFAVGVRIKRQQRGHGNRGGAKAIGISTTTLSRLENGVPVSIDSVLAACRYVGVHPFHYVVVPARGFTKNISRNTLRVND